MSEALLKKATRHKVVLHKEGMYNDKGGVQKTKIMPNIGGLVLKEQILKIRE